MFTSPIAASPDAPTVVTTNPVSYALKSMDGSSSIYGVAGLDLDEPMSLTVQHQVTSAGVARHNVKVEAVHQDDTDITISGTIGVSIVISVPKLVATAALVKAEVHKLVNFLETAGVIDKILNSEI